MEPLTGTAQPLTIRSGGTDDEPVVLALFDDAVAWLVARGQTGQWGTTPASKRSDRRAQIHAFATSGGLHIAEREGETVGAVVTGEAPSYVAAATGPEVYILLLLTSRRYAGQGIGSALVARAIGLAREQGARLIRVDCWAGAPTLVRWYERQGFTRAGTFDVNGWPGQLFAMEL